MRRDRFRKGSGLTWVFMALVAVAALGFFGFRIMSYVAMYPTTTGGAAAGAPLVVFCAASNQAVMEEIRADYEREFSRPLQIQYGASQVLLASLEVSGTTADLFLPADASYLDDARSRGLVAEVIPLARMHAVVAVPEGNPLGIASWSALVAAGRTVAQGSPDATAIGKLTQEKLEELGLWQALQEVTTLSAGSIHDVATAVKVGSVEAGIVFDAVLSDYPDLEAMRLDELSGVEAAVGVGVTRSCQRPTEALHLARYIAASDRGLEHYRQHGFETVEGDPWEEQPELELYAGAMLRPAVEETIKAFEQREGVRVTRIYNGCGILVAQMKAGEVPDAYFACDAQFMDMVQDLFGTADTISQNQLVILVPKGNPRQIASLADLAKPDLRVGIGHEKQCAMGWITQRTFEQGGVQDDVMKNVVVQTPTGDMLVNQMRTGSLDAAVVYLSNAAGAAEALDAVAIQGIPCSIALQPYATALDSRHKLLAARLLETIREEESRERFLDEGFVWKAADRSPSRWKAGVSRDEGSAEGGADSKSAPPAADDNHAPNLEPRAGSGKRGFWLGDRVFLGILAIQGGIYVLLILALLAADAFYTSWTDLGRILDEPDIQFAAGLTLVSCTLAASLSLLVATPLGYLLARFRFPGRWLLDSILDIPIVLPPLVIGLSLLILFHLPVQGTTLEATLQKHLGLRVTYTAAAVVLAQFTVACAFAVRTMRVTFDQIDPRTEQVAWTLGCGRLQGYLRVALPQARKGMLAAFTLAWARSLGEFGPILVFAGATRQRTEVLSTTVFLELSVGNLESAVAVSLVMVAVALIVLILVRLLGAEVIA